MTAKEVPQGIYKYEVRGDDETTGGFAQLAKRVLVNHYGTILTKKPIDLGKHGYIAFEEDTEPNFIGESMALAEFMLAKNLD